MTIADLFKALGGNIADLIADYGIIGTIAIVLILSCIQATPTIKWNPWSWLGSKIGQCINREVLKKVGALEEQIKDVQSEQAAAKIAEEERNAKSARIRILRFGDEVRNQKKHTKEHFDDILQDISEYETYCENHPYFKNNKAKLTIEHIQNIYRERLTKNDFL